MKEGYPCEVIHGRKGSFNSGGGYNKACRGKLKKHKTLDGLLFCTDCGLVFVEIES